MPRLPTSPAARQPSTHPSHKTAIIVRISPLEPCRRTKASPDPCPLTHLRAGDGRRLRCSSRFAIDRGLGGTRARRLDLRSLLARLHRRRAARRGGLARVGARHAQAAAGTLRCRRLPGAARLLLHHSAKIQARASSEDLAEMLKLSERTAASLASSGTLIRSPKTSCSALQLLNSGEFQLSHFVLDV